jgi:hypothetical protein
VVAFHYDTFERENPVFLAIILDEFCANFHIGVNGGKKFKIKIKYG